MSGTGNILLKRGTIMPYNNAQSGDDIVLPKGMPAVQLTSSSTFMSTSGLALENYPNRFWVGSNLDTTGAPPAESAADIGANRVFKTITASGGSTITSGTHPLWMGAEIRAYTPLKEDGGSVGNFVVLKADWDFPSDNVLVTQRAIATMPLRWYETNPEATQREYIEFGGPNSIANAETTKYVFPTGATLFGSPGAPAVLTCVVAGAADTNRHAFDVTIGSIAPISFMESLGYPAAEDIAFLNDAGTAKGLQTFKSKTRIEQELQLNAYVDANNISHGATITSLADDAFIFNETVSDISIGGEASVISIGNPGTNGCSVIIYDELTVEGELIAQLIDGGSF